ncbi:MAG TPA: cytochrome c [Bacteroidia bacterium]|nr:cytochrome c [Bacteroidia bacterium]
MTIKKTLFAFILIGLTGCATSLYVPTQEMASNDATLEQLTEGRALYASKCGNCHKLHRPAEYDAERWTRNLNKMQKRAKITEEEKGLIYQYLIHHPEKKS